MATRFVFIFREWLSAFYGLFFLLLQKNTFHCSRNKQRKNVGFQTKQQVIPIVFQSELLRNLEITMVNADRKLESHWEFANQRLSLISNRYNSHLNFKLQTVFHQTETILGRMCYFHIFLFSLIILHLWESSHEMFQYGKQQL